MDGRPLEQARGRDQRGARSPASRRHVPDRALLDRACSSSRAGRCRRRDDNIEQARATTSHGLRRRRRHGDAERHSRRARASRTIPSALRFVTFLTDGYIGNEAEILGEVQRTIGDARIFSFGVGNSVNRYLLDGLATEGRGAVAYLGLERSARRGHGVLLRAHQPARADRRRDRLGRHAATDVYPARLPDSFAGRPVVVTGKFSGEPGDVVVRGRLGAEASRIRRRRRGSDSQQPRAAQPLGAPADRGSREAADVDRRSGRPISPQTIRDDGARAQADVGVHVVRRGRRQRAHGRRARHDGESSRARAGGVRYDTTVNAER